MEITLLDNPRATGRIENEQPVVEGYALLECYYRQPSHWKGSFEGSYVGSLVGWYVGRWLEI